MPVLRRARDDRTRNAMIRVAPHNRSTIANVAPVYDFDRSISSKTGSLTRARTGGPCLPRRVQRDPRRPDGFAFAVASNSTRARGPAMLETHRAGIQGTRSLTSRSTRLEARLHRPSHFRDIPCPRIARTSSEIRTRGRIDSHARARASRDFAGSRSCSSRHATRTR